MDTPGKKSSEEERLVLIGKAVVQIAHELKNSLVLIKTFTQLIQERRSDAAFVRKATQNINQELDNWNAMLRNLVDFARDDGPLKSTKVDIKTLMKEVPDLAKVNLKKKTLK